MKLGLQLGYWGAGPPSGVPELIRLAESCGYDSAWTAEAYGSDALTPLAWWGSSSTKLRLGTSIMQLSARTPAAAAMAAISMDHLTGGRFILGVGASGPQVVEGWYGQPYPKPLARTREYIDIIRKIVERQGPVEHLGEFYQLPYQGGSGLGKPLRSTVHPVRSDLPIFLAAEGPKNVSLAAEIADGWFPFWYSPRSDRFYRDALAEGFATSGARRTLADFEVVAPMMVAIDDDVDKAADRIRPQIGLYVGGMGAKNANFHADVFVRMGYERECEQIQELYLAGKKAEAIASIPLRMVEDVALVGPKAKIKDDLERWKGTVVTTMVVGGDQEVIRMMAELVS